METILLNHGLQVKNENNRIIAVTEIMELGPEDETLTFETDVTDMSEQELSRWLGY